MPVVLEVKDPLRSSVLRLPLERKRYVLGTGKESEHGIAIKLTSAFVKRDHALLMYDARGWTIKALQPHVRKPDDANSLLSVGEKYRFRVNSRITIGDLEVSLVEVSGAEDQAPIEFSLQLGPLDSLIEATKLRVSNETERLAGRGKLNQDDPDYTLKIRPIIQQFLTPAIEALDQKEIRLKAKEALRRDLIYRILGHEGTLARSDSEDVSEMDRQKIEKTHRAFFRGLQLSFEPRMQRSSLRALTDNFERAFRSISTTLDFNLLKKLVDATVSQSVQAIMTSIGPLEPLREIDQISEIMVVSYDEIFVEIDGVIMLTGLSFVDERSSMKVAAKIARDSNTSVDRSMPYRDGRLSDGSRVNMVIPPIALKGATVTIRKFGKSALSLETLLLKESISPAMASFLQACVVSKKNIVVSGGTGTGKTTMVNWLGTLIPSSERVITIEDTAELRLELEHLVTMQAVAKTADSDGHSIRDLVRNALRMRPDRIIVGECRGAEAFDMLQAMNTGHEGSMTTLHANNPVETMSRIENLVLGAREGLPVDAIRYQIAGSIDYVVQLRQYADGSRKISEIAEVGSIDQITKRVEVNPIFQTFYNSNSPEAGTAFAFAGRTPTAIADIVEAGFDASLLMPGSDSHEKLRREFVRPYESSPLQ